MNKIFNGLIKSGALFGLTFSLLILVAVNLACLAGGPKKIDTEIVGAWRHQEMLGDPQTGSMVIVRGMLLRENGTALFVDGGGEETEGEWYTRGNNLYYVSANGEEVYAGTYSTNGNSLLIQGNRKELWERVE